MTTFWFTPNAASATVRRAAAAALTAAIALGSFAAHAQTVNVVDVGGALALLQDAIESYKTKNPNVKFTFTKAPAPELPSKLKAMQAAGRTDIDLVLGGTDILSAGIEQNLWARVLPDQAAKFPGVLDNYLPQARKMQELAHDQALAVVFMPAGPLLEFNPDKVKQVPTTPQELLAWCKANPNRFIYGRPANSGPGRTFMMGLPYLLGDKDPKDPVNGWDKTWAYLKQLNTCIEYYPGGTGAVMRELGEGSRDMTVSVTGWDINPRALGVVPKDYRIAAFKDFTWVNDTQYMMTPKGLSPREAGTGVRSDGLPAAAGTTGAHLRQGLLLPGPGGEERAHHDGAAAEPGRHQGIRPRRVRRLDREPAARAASRFAGAREGLSQVGRRSRRTEAEVSASQKPTTT